MEFDEITHYTDRATFIEIFEVWRYGHVGVLFFYGTVVMGMDVNQAYLSRELQTHFIYLRSLVVGV